MTNPMQAILVAVDGGKQMAEVLDLALSMVAVRGGGATIHVLCVADSLAATLAALGPVSELTLEAADAQAADVVARALAHLEAAGATAQGHVVPGRSTEAIVEHARRFNCSLVVLGHRHMSLWRQIFDHSTCFDVLDHSPCPVLIATGGHK